MPCSHHVPLHLLIAYACAVERGRRCAAAANKYSPEPAGKEHAFGQETAHETEHDPAHDDDAEDHS